MQLEEELARFSLPREALVAVGVFDGVHRGHRFLISRLKELAAERGLASVVLTFRQHPLEVLAPPTVLPYLTDAGEKAALLGQTGVDTVAVISFTPEVAALSAGEFIALLQKHLRMRGLVMGPDFALGRGREGDTARLEALGREAGFTVTVVAAVEAGGEVVSSTAIRHALAAGDMSRVTRLLGRPYRIRGTVVTGAGRGAGIGFPTANFEVDPKKAMPPEGVYATWAHVGGRAHPSMTNIGRCPTFGGQKTAVEVHLLDFSGDLYGQELAVELVERLRDERRFDSVDELRRQIAEDVRLGSQILGSHAGGHS